MNGSYPLAGLLAHVLVVVVSLSVVAYSAFNYRTFRRTMRKPRLAYWLALLVCLFCALANVIYLVHFFTPGRAPRSVVWMDWLAEYPSLVAQSLTIAALISLRVRGHTSVNRRRILAVGAHPDDIEIACGGTLAVMRDSGYEVHGLVLTQGEKGGNAKVRPGEAVRGASFLGLDRVKVLDLPDTCLQERSLDVLAAIEAEIVDFEPDIVFTHSSHDLHQDHWTVHEATLRAARNQSMVLCYESPSVTQEFVPTFFVDIGDYVTVKVESIREHADQRDKPYVKAERVQGTAVFRGAQAKTRYAEGFEVVRVLFSAMVPVGHPAPSKRQLIPAARTEPVVASALPRLGQESSLP